MLPRVERRVRRRVWEEHLVASECERLASTFATRQFPSEISAKVVHRAAETVALKQVLRRVAARVFVSCPVAGESAYSIRVGIIRDFDRLRVTSRSECAKTIAFF